MTDSTADIPVAVPPAAPKRAGVKDARQSDPSSMTRKSRWKRRGKPSALKRFGVPLALMSVGFVGLSLVLGGPAEDGPDGPFAVALVEAFPEADPKRVEMRYGEDGLPLTATLHVPAHLLEPGEGIGDPFARLSAEFGGAERTLSGVEMGERLAAVVSAVLPDEMARCQTYKVGAVSSAPDTPARTRALHIHLNPGC